MKKAFDQTFRDIKREVNKKVLKVPGIEQKVLDATSNEPWGPHGSLLADIAQATRNYHEYQMIMAVIWKRINDTGKNWRHVYKGLTVLEYLVAHGSERVIDEIKEHAYQISTLSDFQYIDSSGRDQGSNVRKKSQSLVLLVNDKERIQEVRQKAAANRDKFRNTSSTGGMYRPSSYSGSGNGDRYDDDRYEGRYGSRDDDRNGYGRERESGYRDDDRYGRYGDYSGRDGDRYGRDYEERSGRDGYRDDDYRGRSRSVDDYNYGSRSRSSDRDRDRGYDDDGNSSSRGSGARIDEHTQDARRLDRKFSEQNLGAPPSYEEAVTDARSPVHNERDGETSVAFAPKTSSPPASTSPSQAITGHGTSVAPANQGVDGFDEFDPRGSISAAPPTSTVAEVDLLGSLSESYSSNALAIMPSTSTTATSEVDSSTQPVSGLAFSATSAAVNQSFEDPFGDAPFKASPSMESVAVRPQNFAPTTSFHTTVNQSSEQPHSIAPKVEIFGGDSFAGSNVQLPAQFMSQEMSTPNHDIDILADILPPPGPSPPTASQAAFSAPFGQLAQPSPNVPESFLAQSGSIAPVISHTASQVPSVQNAQNNGGFFPQSGFNGSVVSNMAPQAPSTIPAQHNGMSFLQQSGSAALVASHMAPQAFGPNAQNNTGNFLPQSSPASQVASHVAHQTLTGSSGMQNSDLLGGFLPQVGQTNSMNSQPCVSSSAGQLAIIPQPSKDKFETKSTVWADTLSRGLVNLNISGSKINPLADIGIDFDAINRKEKRMEKPAASPVTSNVTMGKAMGSGSGVGRTGAGALLRPPANPMMGSGMGMGMGMGMGGAPGAGMGPGGYGGINQPMGMNMGMGMGMNIGMNMGMGQGAQMQRPGGLPPGSTMPGGYNPMMGGGGGYNTQPYGGGYR